ncbi:Hsp20/alpha crystallin family protein [Noviherbaspirillum sp. L7-7A]|uniref:Hsp20/alpha crystallin family protein n=1 Tax=Noviherbaspirillum sp. L7-7A TaxID=2850560 RepID=UPI001C2B77E2|nr:Hsp20/alpha crystallin family protein [Noviherbaspirillum sp. L7-7A]MBV0881244.1 Hsp20/alpha crystallin family protein [Noviherbaspirillum sp. L7-7A]
MQASGKQKEGQERALLPPVDVVEDANGITLYADLPGVSRENLSLHLETDSLTIEGTVALDVPQDMQSSHADVTLPRYRRVFTLSKELDAEQASAELKNGVLTLRIPKAQHAQPRRIEVKVA